MSDQITATPSASDAFGADEVNNPSITPTPESTAPPAPEPAATPAPAEPTTAPAPEPTATPVAEPTGPKTVTVNGKTYTVEELEKALNSPEPAPAPGTPPAPAAPVKELTPEEIASKESAWKKSFREQEKISHGFSTEELDTFLSGGEDAVKLISEKLSDVAANAVLLARKSILADLNPRFQEIAQALTPLVGNHAEVERVTVRNQFVAAHPDFKEDVDFCESIASKLVEKFPEEVSKMSREQFLAEVARQADQSLQKSYKQWNPAATDTWRDARKRSTASASPAPAAPAAAAPATPPAPAAPPAAPKPAVVPPMANTPAAVGITGQPNWAKSVVASLMD